MNWERLKEIGLGELGWSPDTFWQSTFSELYAAMRGRFQRSKEKYYLTGSIVAAIYNVNRDPQKHRMLDATDIFPWVAEKPKRGAHITVDERGDEWVGGKPTAADREF